jgi:hypothetical protein
VPARPGLTAGEHRNVDLVRSVVRVSEGRLAHLKARIEEFVHAAEEQPDDSSVWTTILWVAVDRESRPVVSSGPPEPAAENARG